MNAPALSGFLPHRFVLPYSDPLSFAYAATLHHKATQSPTGSGSQRGYGETPRGEGGSGAGRQHLPCCHFQICFEFAEPTLIKQGRGLTFVTVGTEVNTF